ncbi:MAG: class I SAM-dependent methyltransferase [Candidatus Acidiferrales bacterium]
MSIRDRVKGLIIRAARLAASHGERELRDSRNVELVLSAALQNPDVLSIRHPTAYVELLRTCIEESTYTVVPVKSDGGAPEIAARRLVTLIDQLRLGLPEIEFLAAREIAVVADANRSNPEPQAQPWWTWAGDVGLHFSIGSSFGRKGRILFNLVRFMRSERCLELGTGYGMSALFILAALQRYSPSGRLHTLEGSEPQFSIASSTLKQRHGDMVSCHFGSTGTLLAELVKSIGPIDFMFHDAGHSHEGYVNDFNEISQILVPGSIVLFDDIRWKDERWKSGSKSATDTYAGWREVVSHSRVSQAVEIDGNLGLLLLR